MPFVLNKINHPYYLFSCHLIFRYETNHGLHIVYMYKFSVSHSSVFVFSNFIAWTLFLFIELFIVIEGNVYLYQTSSASSQLDRCIGHSDEFQYEEKKKSCIIDTSSTIGNGKSEGTTVSRSGEKCGQNDRRHQNKNFISQNNSNHRLSTSSLMPFPYSLTVKLFFFSFVVVFFCFSFV